MTLKSLQTQLPNKLEGSGDAGTFSDSVASRAAGVLSYGQTLSPPLLCFPILSILSKEPEFKTYVSRFHCTLHASQAGITCVFLRNNVSSVLKLLDLKNPFSPFPSFQSLSSIPPLQFQLCVPAFPKAQPIPYSACHNSALSFPNISFTLQTTLRSRFPTFHSLRLFCVPPSPTLLPGTLLSLINITRTSFSTLSPHPSAHFFSPYLETPFCSPNHYPRMPNTPPSSSNPALFPPHPAHVV